MIAKGKNGDRRRNLKRKAFCWLMTLCMVFSTGAFTVQTASAAAGDPPDHHKTLIENGDGTYTIALDVTGDSEKQIQKVNVIVIVDRSNSMDTQSGTGAYVPSNQNWTNMYGIVDGEYVPLTRTDHGYWANPRYTYTDSNGNPYNGQRYQYDSTASRLQATKAAVDTLSSTLLGYNGKDGNPNDTVEMALVSFGTTASTDVSPTTDVTTFTNAVNAIETPGGNAGGTNWEMALRQADTINFGANDKDPTYVIFFSDGAPTFYGTRPNGSGQEEEPNMGNSYNASTDEAAALATKVGPDHFYTIFAYGSNAGRTYMANLTAAAGAPAANNYSASNTAELNDAFAQILASIELAGIGNVSLNDGTTSSVATTSGEISHLLTVDENSYKYYRAGGTNDEGAEKYKSSANNGLGEEWPEKSDSNPDGAPPATFTSGSVKWDLASEGVLEDDVTYTVTFDCWPSQTTLDIVADIKNDPSSYDSLDANIQKYINRDGSLKTNTTATLTYKDTRTGQDGSIEYDNPDPVQTTAVEQLAISKEWENELDSQAAEPVTLTVTRDGTAHHTMTLKGPSWASSTYISIGILRHADDGAYTDSEGEKFEVLETGHDFTFKEPKELGYYWELEVPTVRPMLVDGTLTMLILKGAAPFNNPDGTTEYTFGGKTYYEGETGEASLTAINHRRARLNLTKVVDGADADPDQAFPFTLNVVNAKASEGTASNLNSDYYVWFSIYNGGFVDGVVSGATKEITEDPEKMIDDTGWTGYYYAPSGSNISVNLKAGDNLRFLNLPTGSTYTFTEGTMPANYTFTSSELTAGTDSTFNGAKTTTGTIKDTNTDYTVTYTNTYSLTDIEITKVWEDEGDQDGERPTAEEFKSWLTLKADGEDVTAANASKLEVTDNEDGTYTATWTGLDRYADDEEIEYTVTETIPEAKADIYAVDGEATVEDGGTITNVHEPEVIEVKATKVWQDDNNQDGLRPNTITLRLGIEAEDGTVTPVADQPAKTISKDATGAALTVTWTDLPKCKDGEEIKYTVTEDPVDDYTTNITGDPATGFTVTNIHVSEKRSFEVQKIWDDSHDKDEYRPEKITVYLYADGELVDEQEVSGTGDTWSYLWDNTLPKYKNGGEPIVYTAREKTEGESWAQYYNQKEGQPVIVDTDTQTKITNSHESDKTSFQVWKIWDDEKNQDGLRPESIEVQLLEDGQPSTRDDAKVTLNEQNHWTYKWDNLEENKEVTAVEVTPDEDASDNGGTQKAAPAVEEETTDLVTDTEGDGEAVESEDSVEAPADEPATDTDSTEAAENADSVETPADEPAADGTAPEKRNAPSKAATKIKYEAQLVIQPVNGYEKPVYETVEGGVEITNKHVPDKTTVTVTKVWNDENDQDGKRADVGATVQLYANGEAVESDPVEVGTADNWSYTWENLDVNAGGQPIVYTVQEELPEDSEYTMESIEPANGVTAQEGDSGTITVKNEYTPEVIDIPVKKIWDDADNQDGIRPDSVTVKLLADETETGKTVTLSESNQWTDTFTGLPKNSSGTPIEYTIEEVKEGAITGSDTGTTYAISYGTEEDGTLTVTNKHTPRTTSISVTKEWKDENNQDGYRPTANQFKEIVHLYANGVELKDEDGKPLYTPTVTDNEDGTFTISFTGLPENAMGSKITWTVGEDTAAKILEKYQVKGDAVVGDDGTITNVHDPEKVTIEVTKKWVDENNKYGLRPSAKDFSKLLVLKADGEEPKNEEGDPLYPPTFTDNGDNTYTIKYENLPKRSAGKEIVYTIDEVEVDGYKTEFGDLTPVTEEDSDEVVGYTLEITNTMEFGKLKVTKVLPKYETSNTNGTTFVFRVIAKVGDKQILNQVMSINMDSAGTETAWLPVLLPASAKVTVTEEYTGTAYKVTGPAWEATDSEGEAVPDWDANDPSIVANGVTCATFTNEYNGEITQSYGILNTYQKSGDNWTWLDDIKDSLGFTEPGNATQAPADQNTGE